MIILLIINLVEFLSDASPTSTLPLNEGDILHYSKITSEYYMWVALK
jgi:hypothetical protein